MTYLRVGLRSPRRNLVGSEKIKGEVLLRRARVNEIGFEFVGMDLDSRTVARVLVEPCRRSPTTAGPNWTANAELAVRSQLSGKADPIEALRQAGLFRTLLS